MFRCFASGLFYLFCVCWRKSVRTRRLAAGTVVRRRSIWQSPPISSQVPHRRAMVCCKRTCWSSRPVHITSSAARIIRQLLSLRSFQTCLPAAIRLHIYRLICNNFNNFCYTPSSSSLHLRWPRRIRQRSSSLNYRLYQIYTNWRVKIASINREAPRGVRYLSRLQQQWPNRLHHRYHTLTQ